MITQEQIPQVLDHPVYDTNGDRVGEVKHVFLDDITGRPEWLCVKTGLFGTKETFVPTRSAEVIFDHVEVWYDKERIRHAPNVDVDARGHLSAAEEQELYRYYDIDWAWQQANEPAGEGGPGGWAHRGGRREQERLGTAEVSDSGTDATGDPATRSEEWPTAREGPGIGRPRLRRYLVIEEVDEDEDPGGSWTEETR